DGLTQGRPAVRADQNDLRPDHKVPICRGDYTVFEFNEVDSRRHALKGLGCENLRREKYVSSAISSTVNCKKNRGHQPCQPARDDFRSAVSALSTALLISDAYSFPNSASQKRTAASACIWR